MALFDLERRCRLGAASSQGPSKDQLPPKQRLPRTFRTCVGNDTKARSHCPINGTRPFNIVKFSYHRQRDHERKRKAQGEVRRVDVASLEGQTTMELGVQGARGMERPLSGDTHPTIVHSPKTVPEAECFHSWSIHDPAATVVPVDHHDAPTPARAVPRQPSCPPPAATNAQEQHIPEHNFIQFQPPDPFVTTASLSRRSTYIADNAFAARSATPSPDLKTSDSPSAGSSTLLPTVWSWDPEVSAVAPSTPIAPEHNPASPAGQGSIWSEDNFIAAYQSFFLPHPIKDLNSPAQALGLIHHDLHSATAQQANDGPTLEAYETKPTCTDATTATVGYTCTTKESGNLIDWTLRLMAVAPADPQQSEALKMAATAGYARTLNLHRSLIPSGVPEEAYAAMHPSPPTVQSSDSELAHALECRPNISATSSAHAWATMLRPAVPVTDMARALHPSPAWAWTSPRDRHATPVSSP
ncbi:hypothetical protein V8D89_001914 [Ganoderma adspersum]